MFHRVFHFFDKLEDRVRGKLSRYPIIYTLIGGVGIVMFWRGVWDTQDQIMHYLQQVGLISERYAWIDGPLSIVISVCMLLITGLFVSFFVTDRIILTGIKQERKLAEKTEAEVQQESSTIAKLETTVTEIEKEVKEIHDKLL